MNLQETIELFTKQTIRAESGCVNAQQSGNYQLLGIQQPSTF